jgi:hypothetical protein
MEDRGVPSGSKDLGDFLRHPPAQPSTRTEQAYRTTAGRAGSRVFAGRSSRTSPT